MSPGPRGRSATARSVGRAAKRPGCRPPPGRPARRSTAAPGGRGSSRPASPRRPAHLAARAAAAPAAAQILRRHRQAAQGENEPSAPIFTTGDLLIDYAQHQVLLRGRPIQLSRTEYKLLSVLAQNAGRVMTHELLLERVWGAEYNREVDFIWVYISRLRRKIEADSRHPRYILTVPDVGYKLAKL